MLTRQMIAIQHNHPVTGKPFNIASYALRTHMLADQRGLEPGHFIWAGGDTHLYLNHLDQGRVQLERARHPLPRLRILRTPDAIDRYAHADFAIENYQAHPHIKAEVAV